MSKEALIMPSNVVENHLGKAKKDALYLTVQRSRVTEQQTRMPIIILGHVWITRYNIVFDEAGSRVGLEEIAGKTDYAWDILR
ncbi:uncharacterized protein FOMMEDRAFT_161294 [Fomitiporia mediterranea MF3/22]|uniref:uncharacterized protein n=1 Tax=Fomitiporia mediterranea (strain MF3/22) TaxID=694068 RepID=UPI00044094D9|nr:uncharacterized protein FOMMEDRAFT_161294 [Fomitiporia mediterranea MF3/22]EJC99065.1 hypothetical protein FOMMEDRAFT_161294 [Fomitiporia mediterranea MF3/22]